MDMIDRVDPEMVEPLQAALDAMGDGLDLRDVAGTRSMIDGMVAAIKQEVPPIEGVATEDRRIPGPSGEPDVGVRIYRPVDAEGRLPGLIWMHPGGFAIGSIELDDLMAAQLAKDVSCVLVSVEYRLAPENPFPAAINDCYSVLGFCAEHAGELGIVGERIAVGGSSAGGGLAAGLALMARDKKELDIAYQMLIYPAINDKNTAPADEHRPDTLFWNRANNRLAWQHYLGGRDGSEVSPYAAPYRSTNLSGLPPAFVAVGELDLFIDDSTEYARRLIAAGVPTELHVYAGAFHAFDAFAPATRTSQRFVADRNAALRRALHG
jgi:acetyl esterase/lipase